MKKIIQTELIRINKIEKEIERILESAPEGKIRCSSCRGDFQYYQGRKYISKKKMDYIKQLAQKDYCKSLQSTVKKLKNNLDNLIKIYSNEELEGAYQKLSKSRKAVVVPLIKPIEDIIREFESIEY